ncbi:hypothetical protein ACQ4PT_038010 [Festuca glaucescens]
MELKDLTQRIPEDALAAVLRRLPPHSLAAARCVCKTPQSAASSTTCPRTSLASWITATASFCFTRRHTWSTPPHDAGHPCRQRHLGLKMVVLGLMPLLVITAILFDPAVSPHYEVLRISSLPWRTTGFELQLEWPPSPFVMHVFSSTTGNWEERSFARCGDAIRTVTHLQQLEKRSVVPHLSAYWSGELCVLTQFVTRISLSNNT